jgi:hypothetical protein
MSTRFTSFLKGAEERLRADSKAIGDALDHHGEIGMGREDSLRRELRLLLPSAYQVTSGFVIGAQKVSRNSKTSSFTTRCTIRQRHTGISGNSSYRNPYTRQSL